MDSVMLSEELAPNERLQLILGNYDNIMKAHDIDVIKTYLGDIPFEELINTDEIIVSYLPQFREMNFASGKFIMKHSINKYFIDKKDYIEKIHIFGMYKGFGTHAKDLTEYVANIFPYVIKGCISSDVDHDNIKEYIRDSFKLMDSYIKDCKDSFKCIRTGVSCNISILYDGYLYNANIGDVYSCVITDNYELPLSYEHNLQDDYEFRRLFANDVIIVKNNDQMKLHNTKSNITRCFGFIDEEYILKEPSIVSFKLTENENLILMISRESKLFDKNFIEHMKDVSLLKRFDKGYCVYVNLKKITDVIDTNLIQRHNEYHCKVNDIIKTFM